MEDIMRQKNYPSVFRNYQRSWDIRFLSSGIIFLFIFSACSIHDLSTEPDNHKKKVEGSGNLITEEIEVPYYSSITMNTAGLVTLTQGTEQNVKVTVDENIMEYIIIRVQDDDLIIEVVNNVTLSDYELTIDVSMTDLEALVTNSAGSIRGLNTFEEDEVNLMVNSAGNIFLDINASQLNSMCNSAGNLFLSGQVTEHNVMLSSAGNLFAFELLTDTTTIVLNSVGNAQVFASKLLDVTINSIGSVYYKGDPVIIQHINSLGRIYSAN
jgi:hypothetical protein